MNSGRDVGGSNKNSGVDTKEEIFLMLTTPSCSLDDGRRIFFEMCVLRKKMLSVCPMVCVRLYKFHFFLLLLRFSRSSFICVVASSVHFSEFVFVSGSIQTADSRVV